MKVGTLNRLVLTALLVCAAPSAFADLDALRAQAAQGDAVRQLELGELYEFGFRLDQNLVPALAWYLLAAEQGNAKAAARRDQLKARLTAEQVAAAEREAARLRPARTSPDPIPASTSPDSAMSVSAPGVDAEAVPVDQKGPSAE